MLLLFCVSRAAYADQQVGITSPILGVRLIQLYRSHENFIDYGIDMNITVDIETLYARLGERDYEAVMSYLADDIAWIVADNSPLADRSPYRGIAEVRSGVFERLTAGFDKLVFDADEILVQRRGESCGSRLLLLQVSRAS